MAFTIKDLEKVSSSDKEFNELSSEEKKELKSIMVEFREGEIDISILDFFDTVGDDNNDRTPGIRRALKAMARTRGSNKRRFLAGKKKGFSIGGKKVSRATFVKKIGGIPKSWKEELKKRKKDEALWVDGWVDDVNADQIIVEDKVDTIVLSWDTRENIAEMIKDGSVNTEDAFNLSDADINKLLGEGNDQWDNVASVHLARNISFERDDKKRYMYPVIKDGKVFKSALINAKKQAEKDDSWLMHTIDRLIGMINKTEGIVNTDNIRHETRVDFFDLPDKDNDIDPFMEEPFKKNDEGFLEGRAIVTNIGVFKYRDRNTGDIIRELRHPDDVFDPDSLATLGMLPITDTHSGGKVDINNIKDLQAGHSGDSIRRDNLHLSTSMKITKKETIDGIVEEGRKAISCGYKVELVDEKGTFLGSEYDVRQTKIRYNHIAVNIDRGRAGDATRIKMDERYDSFDALRIDDEEGIENKNKNKLSNKEENNMDTIKIDGADFQAERQVIQHIHKIQDELDTLKKDHSDLEDSNKELQGKYDALDEEKKKVDGELEEAKKTNPDKVDEEVQARINLIETAKKFDVELKEDKETGKVTMTNDEIKKAIICKDAPEGTAEKLEKADSVYINARFDAKLEILEAKLAANEDQTANANANDVSAGKDGQDPKPEKTAKEAHDAYKENLKNAHKPKEE